MHVCLYLCPHYITGEKSSKEGEWKGFIIDPRTFQSMSFLCSLSTSRCSEHVPKIRMNLSPLKASEKGSRNRIPTLSLARVDQHWCLVYACTMSFPQIFLALVIDTTVKDPFAFLYFYGLLTQVIRSPWLWLDPWSDAWLLVYGGTSLSTTRHVPCRCLIFEWYLSCCLSRCFAICLLVFVAGSVTFLPCSLRIARVGLILELDLRIGIHAC